MDFIIFFPVQYNFIDFRDMANNSGVIWRGKDRHVPMGIFGLDGPNTRQRQHHIPNGVGTDDQDLFDLINRNHLVVKSCNVGQLIGGVSDFIEVAQQ